MDDYYEIPIQHEDAVEYGEELVEGPSVDELIDQHIDFISQIDARLALEQISMCDLLNSIITGTPVRDDFIGLPQSLADYLIGLIIEYGDPDATKNHTYEELAGPLFDISVSSMNIAQSSISPESSEEEKIKSRIESTMKQQAFATGEFMMTEQPLRAARRAYSPHDKHLKCVFGFTIEEAILCVKYIEMVFSKARKIIVGQDEFQLSKVASDGHALDKMIEQYEESGSVALGSDSKDFKEDSENVNRFFNNLSDHHDKLSITEAALFKFRPENLSDEVLESFIKRMTTSLESGQSPTGFRYPYQFNPLHASPIIKLNDRLFLPQSNALRRAVRETFYYDLCNLEGYGNPGGESCGEFGQRYGDYLEDWTFDCVSKLFDDKDILFNPYYPGKGSEEACDILVFGEQTLFVIECKTGKLPLHIRKGDFEEIQSAVQKKVGKGYEKQALNLIKKLRDGKLSKLEHDGELVDIPEYSNYQPVIIVGEPYDGLATYLIDEIVESNDVLPYVLDIFDLQVISEYFKNQGGFDSYVNSRIKLFNNKSIVSPDEVDYLGVYMKNNHNFPEFPKDHFLQVEDMSHYVNSHIDYEFGF